jgi:hypothetical protein
MPNQVHWAGRQCWQPEDDVLVSRWLGAATLEELEPFLAFAERWSEQIEHPFLLIDNSRAAPGRPEVRKRVVQWARQRLRFDGVAVFGGDVATRAIGTLIINAIGLLSGRKLNIVLLADEASARAWIGVRRQELARAGSQPRSL